MTKTVPRKNAVDTMLEAIGWLQRNPILIAVFFVVGILQGLAEISLAFSLIGLLASVYVGAVAHLFAHEEAFGSISEFGSVSSRALGRLPWLVAIYVVYLLAVTVGLLLLVIPGIYLALRLSLALPACVIDDEGVVESFETSWTAAKGNLSKLFGISILAFLVLFGTGIVTVVLGFFGEAGLIVGVLISAVATAVVSPIVQLAYARVYLENRGGDGVGNAVDEGEEWAREREDSWSGETA